jgi:hypothetical protein
MLRSNQFILGMTLVLVYYCMQYLASSLAVMESMRAVEVNPSEVAKKKGMANQQILKTKQTKIDVVSDSCFPKIDSRAFKLTIQGGNHGRHWWGEQQ